MAKFKANFRIEKVNDSDQIVPIYKVETFICRNILKTKKYKILKLI
jgi:hypothetical protein